MEKFKIHYQKILFCWLILILLKQEYLTKIFCKNGYKYFIGYKDNEKD